MREYCARVRISKGRILVEKVKITTEYIKLEQLMKFAGLVGSGSDAKILIGDGTVKVNGSIDIQRGKKLRSGDMIEFEGKKIIIE
jgi:ribosome-associated protein